MFIYKAPIGKLAVYLVHFYCGLLKFITHALKALMYEVPCLSPQTLRRRLSNILLLTLTLTEFVEI